MYLNYFTTIQQILSGLVVSVVYCTIWVVGSNPTIFRINFFLSNWRDLHFQEHFQLEISSKSDIKAENSSTLCKFYDRRKGSMWCNADLLNNWRLKSQLTGINNWSKGLTKNQKQPITPAMLLQLHDWLDMGNSADASFWAICLVAFYGVFRKSHLLPVLSSSFDLREQLSKADFKNFPWGYSSLFDGVRPYNFLNGW